ncbi:hypothetical protein V1478_004222 [Vespula squamosa]|uniref:Uncharacterized protein n=1 Tax=Vespula squamosa TaxID=30214 RepID=A0ABD2BK05_VESSQ
MMAQTSMTTQRKMRHKTEDKNQRKHLAVAILQTFTTGYINSEKGDFLIYLLNNTKIHIKDRNVLISKINIKEKLSEVLQIDIVQEIIEIDPTHIENPEHQKFIKNIVGTLMEIRFSHNRDQDMPTSNVLPPWQIVNPSRRATIPNNKKTIKRIRRQ